ncbi:ricin-type beta-trefoil lectin domain protein [Streptomyces oryzae]|uniref:Ricin-type beta-trefoil lectin domain protein n=1 Tax=Streptomyces oryzae TaxID=1434886 RepID=A0ABS3XMN0_9ACTN|nr:ricin-type beta-trefoil lectin domain protein [Streptomyces oryzae]
MASSLLKKPWAIATAAVALATLITTPIALAGAGGDDKDSGASRKNHAAGTKDDAKGDPSETLRPSHPGYPSGSPSPSPSDKDKDEDKDKDKEADDKPKPSPSESDKGSSGSDEKGSGSGDSDDGVDAAGGVIPSGVITVRNHGTGLCMDLPGTGKGKPDGRVQQGACDTSYAFKGGNQRWELDLQRKDAGPKHTDLYLIRNVKDNLCLDLPGYDPVPANSPVTEYHCRGANDNQLWWLDKRSDGTFAIRNHSSGNLCLSVAGAKKANGALSITGCDGGIRQWRLSKP